MKFTKSELTQISATYTAYQGLCSSPMSPEEFLEKYTENVVIFNKMLEVDNDTVKEKKLTKTQLNSIINAYSKKAKEILADKDKLDDFLVKLSKKIKQVPKYGDKLSIAVDMAMLLNDYIRGNYDAIPMKTLYSIVGALLYFVSPIDFIPDGVPVAGYVDDAAVLATVGKSAEADIKQYLKWREKNKE